LGFGRILPLCGRTGLSACIFFACGKKVYRSYPLRGSKMASMPFLSFRFLQNKNRRIYPAGLHAGRFDLSEFSQSENSRNCSIHAIFELSVFAKQKPKNLSSRPPCRPV
jgi:hypothetical protein